jgi:hypothetical protein
MLAFKLNSNDGHKCHICGETLPPYITRHHRVIIFTEEQVEQCKNVFENGEFVEYTENHPTIGVYEDECKGEIEGLKSKVRCLNEEIERLQKKIQWYENNQPLQMRKFLL